ncbi:MAG: hypothetical protein JWN79_662 [Gemmatimonadetes bacterium]|jgi:hypothetical protein|nr:hypothetical protein [Gemmatimonadota bacterium]
MEDDLQDWLAVIRPYRLSIFLDQLFPAFRPPRVHRAMTLPVTTIDDVMKTTPPSPFARFRARDLVSLTLVLVFVVIVPFNIAGASGHWKPSPQLFGVAMSLLYLRTRKLWVPIAAHALNNFAFIAPSLGDILHPSPAAPETVATLRAQLPKALPLLVATLATFWLWRRYVWGRVSMRGLLAGPTPYEMASTSKEN